MGQKDKQKENDKQRKRNDRGIEYDDYTWTSGVGWDIEEGN